MLLSKLVCDTDQVVSGSAALAVGVDEALLIADAHEAAGANGEAFLWLSAIYGRFRVVLQQVFISDATCPLFQILLISVRAARVRTGTSRFALPTSCGQTGLIAARSATPCEPR